jgi:hypothetical protein
MGIALDERESEVPETAADVDDAPRPGEVVVGEHAPGRFHPRLHRLRELLRAHGGGVLR